ncbi:MAG: site-specific integrase [Peptostreptococcaceae bacterium]|nr:site-specific integrase [Peptostreptococcaceae bacterium]
MASFEKIKRKNGFVCRIKVGNGYDVTGKQIVESLTWKVPEGLTPRQEEKELNKVMVDFEKKVKEGQIFDTVRFIDFSEKWIEYATKNLSPKYVSESKRLLVTINNEIGHIPLTKLKKQHLQTLYNRLSDEVKITQKKSTDTDGNTVIEKIEKKKSANTIIHYHRLILTILTRAVQWDIISSNICLGKGLEMPKKKRYEVKYLDDNGAIKFLELLTREHIQYRTFFALALYTGFRNGELLGLDWADIDFDNCLISVNKSSQYIPGMGIFTKETKNSTSERTIQVIPEIMVLLKQYKAYQSSEQLRLGTLWRSNSLNTKEKYCENHHECSKNNGNVYCSKKCKDFEVSNRLFVQANGIPMHPETPRQWLKKFIKREGLEDFNVHSLRHTNISLMIMQGVPLPTVAKMAGHSSTATTTRIYSHSIKTAEQMAIEKVANISTPNREAK